MFVLLRFEAWSFTRVEVCASYICLQLTKLTAGYPADGELRASLGALLCNHFAGIRICEPFENATSKRRPLVAALVSLDH